MTNFRVQLQFLRLQLVDVLVFGPYQPVQSLYFLCQQNHLVLVLLYLGLVAFKLVQTVLQLFILLPVIVQLLTHASYHAVESVNFPAQTVVGVLHLPALVLILFVYI